MDRYKIILLTMLMGASTIVASLVKRISRKRRFSVRPMYCMRHIEGHFASLITSMLTKEDIEQYFKYIRMTHNMFKLLLSLIESKLRKREMKTVLTPAHRLTITLQYVKFSLDIARINVLLNFSYLAECCSMQEIAFNFRVGKTTVHAVLEEVCDALWKILMPLVLPEPTPELWKSIINGFYNKCNMPNCFGAVDGKHVIIQSPKLSGSQFFNYKKSFSLILMASCDAFYKFTMVDIGECGSNHDSTVFKHSIFGQRLMSGNLNLPERTKLQNTNVFMDNFVMADQAFPLHKHIMRPYPGDLDNKTIFNYRLSRARRMIENTFGILATRWRILRRPIIASLEICEKFVRATIVLHNFIQKSEADIPLEDRRYCPTGYVDYIDGNGMIQAGAWRNEEPLRSVSRLGSNNASKILQNMRNTLSDYFISDAGCIPWQQEIVLRGSVP